MPSGVFARARQSIVLTVVLAGVAMLLYPGGTALDRSTIHYSVLGNFLSDLGMTVAYNGQSNVPGAIAFVAAMLVLVFGLVGALAGFVQRYSVTLPGRRYAYAAAGAGLLATLAFIGVAFTPENRVMMLHVRLTFIAFHLLPIAAILVMLAARASREATARTVRAWAFLAGVLLAYTLLLDLGPSLDTPTGLMTYVIAQKVVTLAVIATMAYQCGVSDRSAPTLVPSS